MKSRYRHQRREDSGLSMTPLVDVMFHLMIFILVTAQYTQIYGMKVDLPSAQSGESVQKEEIIVLTLKQTGELFREDVLIPESDWESTLQELRSQNANQRVLLQADQDAALGGLVRIMDLARKVGLERLSLQTQRAAKP